MKPGAPTEADLAAAVVAYLESCGHDVYQEVAVRNSTGGGVADIVALVGPGREVWIVEVKTGWCLELLRQCMDRRQHAHRVFAACPPSRAQSATEDICGELGIGVLVVRDQSAVEPVELALMARRQSSDPRFARALRERCSIGHKTHAKAGAPSAGGRYTPFRRTCEELARLVRVVPGIPLADAIGRIRHHYSSASAARAAIPRWIDAGMIHGVRAERTGRRIALYPEAA